MEVPEVGEKVYWQIRPNSDIFRRSCSGTVLRTGVEKFGHDDIIVVDNDNNEQVNHVRPKDLNRNHK